MAFTACVVRFRLKAVSSYRLLCIHGTAENMKPFSSTNVATRFLFQAVRDKILAASSRPKVAQREFLNTPSHNTSMTKYDACDPMGMEPVTGSYLLFIINEDKYYKLNAPGLEKTESDERLCVFVRMPEVTKKDVKVSVDDNTWLVIQAKTRQVRYLGRMTLPNNVDKIGSDIKGEMQDGMLKLTFTKLKDKELKTSIFANFISKLHLRYASVVADWQFLRRSGIEILCPKESNSFTMYKEVTADSLHLSIAPRLGKMELTSEGACVSLNMSGFKIEDVKPYFKGDILLIEGKTKTKTSKVQYYITCIRIPQSILKERHMIKTEMQDGMYKATLPYVTTEIKIN